MYHLTRLWWCGVAFAVAAGPATAQSVVRPNEWSRGTTITGFGGVAVDSSRSGSALGAAVGWEVTPQLAIEAAGAWLDRGDGADAFAGSVQLQASLSGPRAAVPFVRGGIGLYRASFNSAHGDMPSVYRDRMANHGTALVARAFTDPAFVVGGGAHVFVTRHVSLRPDVEAMIVRTASRSHVVTTVSLRLSYHFEDHPVTPTRKATDGKRTGLRR